MTAKPRANRPMFAVGSENWICRELMKWVRLNTVRYPWLDRMYHTPNEGRRNPMMAKAMGIRPGVSDYHCPAPIVGLPDLWLEVKAGKNKPTPAQEAWLYEMKLRRDCAVWVGDLQAAIDACQEWCAWTELALKGTW